MKQRTWLRLAVVLTMLALLLLQAVNTLAAAPVMEAPIFSITPTPAPTQRALMDNYFVATVDGYETVFRIEPSFLNSDSLFLALYEQSVFGSETRIMSISMPIKIREGTVFDSSELNGKMWSPQLWVLIFYGTGSLLTSHKAEAVVASGFGDTSAVIAPVGSSYRIAIDSIDGRTVIGSLSAVLVKGRESMTFENGRFSFTMP